MTTKKPEKKRIEEREGADLKKTAEQKRAEEQQGPGAQNPAGTQGGVPLTGKNEPDTTGDKGDYDTSRKSHSASGDDDHKGPTLGRQRLNERGNKGNL